MGQSNPNREAPIRCIQRLVRARVADERLVDALLVHGQAETATRHRTLVRDPRISADDRARFGAPLTDVERQVLRDGSLVLESRSMSDPQRDTQRHVATVLVESLTVSEVAEHLQVSHEQILEWSRVRQLYAASQYGLSVFPRFQFYESGLLPNFRAVAPLIPSQDHLLGVHNWWTLTNCDLFLNDDMDQTVSPREWLIRGGDPDVLIRLMSLPTGC